MVGVEQAEVVHGRMPCGTAPKGFCCHETVKKSNREGGWDVGIVEQVAVSGQDALCPSDSGCDVLHLRKAETLKGSDHREGGLGGLGLHRGVAYGQGSMGEGMRGCYEAGFVRVDFQIQPTKSGEETIQKSLESPHPTSPKIPVIHELETTAR